MKIIYYAVRDLHTPCPDDYAPGAHDVLAKAADGRVYYSEDIFDNAAEARAFMYAEIAAPGEFGYWEDKPLEPPFLTNEIAQLEWVPA